MYGVENQNAMGAEADRVWLNEAVYIFSCIGLVGIALAYRYQEHGCG